MTAVRLVVPSQDECGEASLWDPKAERLYWLDLYRPTLHILDPATREHAAYPVGDDGKTPVKPRMPE